MDISELKLIINKNQAVRDLQVVENQLDKTGSSAESLLSTLRDFGLSTSFAILVKESLQANSEISKLDRRLKSIMGSKFDNKSIKGLVSDLNVSEIAVKRLLATTGQFARGLGHSEEFVNSFAASLTRAAVDYGTFMGMSSTDEFNEIARKFAKATLGEVGELKEIGIVIDAASESFKEYIKEVERSTGLTEEQSRQYAILKSILDQIQYTSGTSTLNLNDGWAQLNRLMDNLKLVLAEIGNSFSKVLSPAINLLNKFLEIPFVRDVTAWSVAIGSLGIGYVALMSSLRKITVLLKQQNDTSAIQEIIQARREEEKCLKRLNTLYKKYAKLAGFNSLEEYQLGKDFNLPSLFNFADPKQREGMKEMKALFERDKGGKKSLVLGSISNELRRMLKEVKDGPIALDSTLTEKWANEVERFKEIEDILENFAKGPIKNIHKAESIMGTFANPWYIIPSLSQMNQQFKVMTGVLAKAKAASIGANIAQGILNLSTMKFSDMFKNLGSLFTSMTGPLKRIFSVFQSGFVGFANVFAKNAEGAAGGAAAAYATLTATTKTLWATIKPIFAAFGKILIVIGALIAAFDLLKGTFNLLTGKAFLAGTAMESLAQSPLFEGLTNLEGAGKRSQLIDEYSKNINEFYDTISKFNRDVEKIKKEQFVKDLLPEAAIQELTKRRSDLSAELIKLGSDIETLKANQEALRKEYEKAVGPNSSMSDEEVKRITESYKRLNDSLKEKTAAYTSAQNEEIRIKEQIIQKQKEFNTLNKTIAQDLSQVTLDLRNASALFGYSYKNGIFSDLSSELGNKNSLLRLKELKNALTETPELEGQKEYLSEIFNLTKETKKYELDALVQQREVTLNNYKSTLELLRASQELTQTSVQAVEAGTMEAVRLQSLRMNSGTSELAPVVEQQKQIKDIESRIFQVQESANREIKNIALQLRTVIDKIGKSSGASVIKVVSPL